jgi:hypothetical protein
VERFLFALLEAAKCMLAFLLVRTVTRSWFAYLAPVLMMVAPGPWHKVFFPAFGFLALYFVVLALARRPVWHLAAGIVAGLAAVFRQDVAGFAAVAGVVGLALETARGRYGPIQAFKRLGLLAAGAALVIGPVLLYFYRVNALGPMIHKITVDGMLDNMTNRLPFPGLLARTAIDEPYLAYVLPVKAFFYLPFAVYALSLAMVVKALVARAWTERHTVLAVMFAASIMAFNQSLWRSDVGHLLQTMQYVFLLLPVVLAQGCWFFVRRFGLVGGRAGALRAALAAAAPLAVLWATVACTAATTDPDLAARFQREGLSVGDSEYVGSVLVKSGNTARLELPRARIRVTPGEARFFSEIGRFLDTNTRPGEYVLAVPQLQTVYFLFDRRNPTRYAHYRRALSPLEESRYIDDIVSHGTTYIFLTEPYEGARLGQTAEAFSEYARPVRNWILANYSPVGRIGWVQILRKIQ